MSRTLLICAALLLGSAQAQGWFVGVSAGFLTNFSQLEPGAGVQVGGRVTESLTLRGGIDLYFGSASAFIVSADVLYTYDLPDTPATLYAGGGLDLIHVSNLLGSPATLPFLHPTLGLEYREGNLGFFGELRFYLYYPSLRAGVNVHF